MSSECPVCGTINTRTYATIELGLCEDHIRKIVKEAVSSILGTSIQADVVKAVATALTSKK